MASEAFQLNGKQCVRGHEREFFIFCPPAKTQKICLLGPAPNPVTLYQYRVNGDTYHNQKALKGHGKQRLEIVVAHMPNFLIDMSRGAN